MEPHELPNDKRIVIPGAEDRHDAADQFAVNDIPCFRGQTVTPGQLEPGMRERDIPACTDVPTDITPSAPS